ncbi:acyltransferase family protein [Chitinophaga sp.]|uniref:acyltransferase family protein n=1 Tax=Chitinophaga sp. TaxID=1869181 RepID=UPI002F925144
MQPTSSSRQAYLDWLRIIAIIGVLFFHSAMPYIPEWGWHIKNKETSNALLEMNDFLHRFRMPLLFFISGTVSYFMLQRNTGGGFIGLRFRRLFVPLLVGILVIVPPQVYMERLTQGFKGNYADFYTHMFTTGVYPHGNMSWHHLWFIAYLLVYDILFAPFFVWLISGNGKKLLQKLNWIGNKQYIYLLIIPGTLVHTFLLVWFRQTGDLVHDYGYFFYWLFYVLAGFICIANPLFMDSLERNRRLSLTIAFTGLLIINYLRWNKLEPWIFNDNFRYMPFTYVYMALGGITAWMWVLAIVGYAKKYLNKPRPILAYANQAVYPFYILHQTVIVILTYYLVTVPDGVGLKYTFTVTVTFLISIFIFHLFIRPFAIMRFLFGMKPMAKGEKRGATKEEELIPVQPGMA